MILHSFEVFKKLARVIIVANKKNADKIKKLLPGIQIILGGKSRQESVLKAVKFLKKNNKLRPVDDDLILIHNAANPFVTIKEINHCAALAKKYGACIVGNPVYDTVKIIDGNFIKQTLPREKIILAQTPQIFKWEILKDACKKAKIKKAADDALIIESIGGKVAWTKSSYKNRKITFPEDAEFMSPKLNARIGIASDYHEFSNSGELTLAGVKFPHYKKLLADSDGDAVFHALAAAVSSALGKGSLGTFASAMCERGIKNSKKYLDAVLKKARAKNFKISNISINIETQKIKIDPLSPQIRASLSRHIKIAPENIGITAIRGKSKNGLYCIAAVLLTIGAAA